MHMQEGLSYSACFIWIDTVIVLTDGNIICADSEMAVTHKKIEATEGNTTDEKV